MGYEIFFGILEFHSASVPGIITDGSLSEKESSTLQAWSGVMLEELKKN